MGQDATKTRELLFVLQGLQTGLIETDELLSAIRQCNADKARSLRETLLAQAAMTSEACGVIDSVVLQHVQKHGDPDRSLKRLAAGVAPTLRYELSTLLPADFEHARAGETAASAQAVDGDDRGGATQNADVGTVLRTPADVPGDILRFVAADGSASPPRFAVLRPHARGGLGIVHVALDLELKREVALKQIQECYADDASSRARFVFEAEVTGALEHPGIVPVYSLGADAKGRPFYAMRFIRGVTLGDEIAAHHSNEGMSTDPGARALQLRKLLRRFIDVCNAIDYAHGRGVLHRDLKPANIVVGEHGETLVVDWGLAKAVGKSESGAADQLIILPGSTNGSAETVEGSALGTPSYMSPEQALGDLDRLGPGSDVCSLGATLYCLLTGRPPFAGRDALEALVKARNSDFPPPRRIDRAIPPTLEAIVLKALAHNPEQRYGTARGLADDIERWMADEPTSARRERFDERARRWMRRRRTTVIAAVAALLAGLAGLGAVVAVQSSANAALLSANSQLAASNRRERQANVSLQSANQKLAASNQRERERFALALDAIKTFHTGVSEDILFKEKAFEGLRTKLLQGAANFYGKLETLLRDHPDRDSRRALSEAYAELAELTDEIGSQKRAVAIYQQSLDLHRALAAEPDANDSDKLNSLRALVEVGRAHQQIGELDRARAIFEESLKIAGQLPDTIDSKRARGLMARSYWNLASVEIDLSHPDQAIAANRKARAIQEELVEKYPEDVQLKVDLVNTDLNNGYNLLTHKNNPDEALICFERARALGERVVAGETENADHLRVLSECSSLIGFVRLEQGRFKLALEALKRAQAIQRKLVEKNPNVTLYQDYLAGDLGNIGIAYVKAGNPQKALEAFTASRRILERLAAADPSAVKFQRDLASTINNIGDLDLGLGRVGDALEVYGEARRLLELLVNAHPKQQHYQLGLAFSLAGQGRAKLKQEKTTEAVALLRASSAIWERLTLSTHESLYVLAGNHALLSGLAQPAASIISPRDAEIEAQRAVECLKKPMAAGYRTAADLRADPQFRALQGRSDFESLLADLQFPQEPFARP
jgi:serine/threonine-protein kinase